MEREREREGVCVCRSSDSSTINPSPPLGKAPVTVKRTLTGLAETTRTRDHTTQLFFSNNENPFVGKGPILLIHTHLLPFEREC